MPISQPYKKQLLLDMLEEGMVMLHLDARHPDVQIPDFLKDDFQLRLNLSYRFADVNLSVDNESIHAVLSFQRTPFACVLPLQAVWGVSSQDTKLQIFPQDLPEELTEWFLALAQISEHREESEQEVSTPENVHPLRPRATSASSPNNIAATSPKHETEGTSTSSPTPTTSAPKRPALQLVVDNTKDTTTDASTPAKESRIREGEQELSIAEKRARFRVISGGEKDPVDAKK